ncbi:unnamed protein product [Rotaria sordida]|uniref:Uncharacterized protein n=1 Tax=Rotaria sordida TaxID=392033 RepID=A0A815CTK1_9BILA|nr:unnamed protein product [Rotaria sordida]CAF3825028.1 unnamed protein product [Rotaria sordida]
MKTPCLTISTTIMTTKNETLNLFDLHRRSTSVMKTLTTATTIPVNILTTTTSISSTTSTVSILVRPILSKISTSHKCSSTTTMIRQFSHIPTSDTSLFAAHHENFSFSLFAPLSSNPTNPAEILSSNLLASSLISNPPLKRF